jgi:hypothetical protein
VENNIRLNLAFLSPPYLIQLYLCKIHPKDNPLKTIIAKPSFGMKDTKQEDTLIGMLSSLNFNMPLKINTE